MCAPGGAWCYGGPWKLCRGEEGPGPTPGRLLPVFISASSLALPGPARGCRACSQGHPCLAPAASVDWLIRPEMVSLPPASGTTIHPLTAAKATFLQKTFQMPCPFTPLCLIPMDQPSCPLSLCPHLLHQRNLLPLPGPGFSSLAPTMWLLASPESQWRVLE